MVQEGEIVAVNGVLKSISLTDDINTNASALVAEKNGNGLKNVIVLEQTDHLLELHTILRDGYFFVIY